MAAVLLLSLSLTGCGGDESSDAPPPPTVIVAEPVVRENVSYYRYSGETRAFDQVVVRARVEGELLSKHFTPSTDVEAGQLLFVIEPAPYEAEVAGAKAELERTKAALELAEIDRDRLKRAGDAVSEIELLEAEATVKQRQAEVSSAEASLKRAEIRLGYTQVTAPIAGRVDRELVDVGSIVGQGDATPLTNIVSMDPIHAYFDVSESIVQEYIQRGKRGVIQEEPAAGGDDPPPVELARSIDPPGEYPFSGVIDYVEPTVDPDTGTMRVRAVFDNEDGSLFPGLFFRARVPYDRTDGAVLIEQRAISEAIDGSFIYVVNDDDEVVRRIVELGDRDGALIVATSGLSAGERYIVSGIQRVRPGQKVDAQFASDAGKSAAGPCEDDTSSAPPDEDDEDDAATATPDSEDAAS